MKEIPPYSEAALDTMRRIGVIRDGLRVLKISRNSEDFTEEMILLEEADHPERAWTTPLKVFLERPKIVAGAFAPYSHKAIELMTHLGSMYQHYKGGFYETLRVSRRLENPTLELVTYQNLTHQDRIWTRPLDMFNETVEVDGSIVPRFKRI